jgi:hypothetical protein
MTNYEFRWFRPHLTQSLPLPLPLPLPGMGGHQPIHMIPTVAVLDVAHALAKVGRG